MCQGRQARILSNYMPAPSVGERLATLESDLRAISARFNSLYADVHGGQGVEFDQSIRGRLHGMAGNLAAADKLIEEMRRERKERADERRLRIKTWQWSVIAGAAILSALSPYVVLFVH